MSEVQNVPLVKRLKEAPKMSRKSWGAVTRAVEYYNQEKFGKALPPLFQYEDVEARAMFVLACMYLKGQGVIKSIKTAASYMMKVIDYEGIREGEKDLLAMAQYYVGDLYFRGVVYYTDYSEAEKHWKKGALLNKDPETGHYHYGTMKCQTALGMMFSSPKHKKLKKALYWHKRAAESGSIISEGALGVMYLYGIGCDQDLLLAYNYLTNAAVMDNIYAKGYLAVFYYKRQMYHRTVSLGMELAEIEDFKLLAEKSDCNVDHVKHGVAVGCFYLALCMQCGNAVEKNIPHSKTLIKKALEISTDVIYDLHVDAILGTA